MFTVYPCVCKTQCHISLVTTIEDDQLGFLMNVLPLENHPDCYVYSSD